MAAPSEVLWDKDPHTEAKHRVYRAYFNAWFPILLQSPLGRGGVTYAEGFSGPGEYLDGSSGSPIIALRSSLGSPAPPTVSRPVQFLLLDSDRRRIAHLRRLLVGELGTLDPGELRRRGLSVDTLAGECRDVMVRFLDEHRVWGRPLLVVLDTWGSAVDFDLLRRIGANRAGEAIVTIQPSQFFRFATDPNHYGDRVFGPVVWRDVQRQPTEHKADYIRAQYRRVLNEAGFQYVLDFELADERRNLLYLVYGTNSERGVEKMKDAMWGVDPYHGVGYRDPRDPAQETLAIEPTPQTAPLRRLITEYLATVPERRGTVDDLRRFVGLGTIFRASQTARVVQRLLDEGLVTRCDTGRLVGSSVVELVDQLALF